MKAVRLNQVNQVLRRTSPDAGLKTDVKAVEGYAQFKVLSRLKARRDAKRGWKERCAATFIEGKV
jgi:hypothetical protein